MLSEASRALLGAYLVHIHAEGDIWTSAALKQGNSYASTVRYQFSGPPTSVGCDAHCVILSQPPRER